MKVASVIAVAGLASASTTIAPSTACASITTPTVDNATITSIKRTQLTGYCSVEIYLTHNGANDTVSIITWLPTAWNGRYQGTGGGGLSAGGATSALQQPVQDGYVASTTDAGVPQAGDGSSWYNNTRLIANFAYQSVHEMTVVGKALAESYYGTAPQYSYWNGCSQGGRQGYMEAQRFPADYDGIYAASPAINYDLFQVAEIWPFVVQLEEGEFVPSCVLDALTAASITACDAQDGALDGILANPNECKFDATSVVGNASGCADSPEFTVTQAKIFNSITQGPVGAKGSKLFSGMTLGSPLSIVASSPPFSFMAEWVQGFVLEDPAFNFSSMTYESFRKIFALSAAKFKTEWGTRNPDLSAFRDAGGKLLSWHGFADQLIGGNGTVQYRSQVEATMGGAAVVDEFYRLFMAPGVGHCGGGTGATPTDPFNALVAWVENGTVPTTLAAAGSGPSAITRNLCPFPSQLQYSGSGSIDLAASWTCI